MVLKLYFTSILVMQARASVITYRSRQCNYYPEARASIQRSDHFNLLLFISFYVARLLYLRQVYFSYVYLYTLVHFCDLYTFNGYILMIFWFWEGSFCIYIFWLYLYFLYYLFLLLLLLLLLLLFVVVVKQSF